MSMKNPLAPAGIEPATFRFVAQHLNHCATAVPTVTLCPFKYDKIQLRWRLKFACRRQITECFAQPCLRTLIYTASYVYGAVHHLDSWVKRKPTWCHLFYYFIQCSFTAQHVSAVNTTIFRSLRLIGCYFMGCIWCAVWSTTCFRLHKDTTPP